MKKIFLLVAGLLWGVAATAQAPFAGGDGTEGDPYQITNRAQLDSVRSYRDKHFRLTADIDLSGDSWTPISTFTGAVHGGNHLVKNITITSTSTYVGLFSGLGANAYIDSLHIVGGNISTTASSGCAGAFAGQISGSATILACSNSANISTSAGSSYTGGIVAYVNAAATIRYCFNSGTITGLKYTGGIIGRGTSNTNISDCYSNADIITNGTSTPFAGGISGYSSAATLTINNSYAAGKIVGSSTSGGIIVIGSSSNDYADVTNSICLLDTIKGDATSNYVARIVSRAPVTGYSNNYGWENTILNTAKASADVASDKRNGADITLADAQSQAFYTSNLSTWNFTSVWAIRDGQSFPY
ncbi:MAG: hypothetical protein LBF67_08705, partial [Prevotellaceae bacterium]|nr:hypothetical protein [Prevotellaceae bacterium]